MEQEKGFEKTQNGQSDDTIKAKREGRGRRYRRPHGNNTDGKSRNPEGKSFDNFDRKNVASPFRKYGRKPNDKVVGGKGNRPVAVVQKKEKSKTEPRVLVVYFSWSGVTEKAAKKITAAVRGNSWRIIPANAYPSLYALCVAKGGMEKAAGARPEIKGVVPDCSHYNKIAIGFPIWWFSCPQIVYSFLEKAKLDGKTVYPFCTSKTSGPKNSAADIRKSIPNAVVKECLDVNKIDSMGEDEIKAWLEV